jgi:hypothetical protein
MVREIARSVAWGLHLGGVRGQDPPGEVTGRGAAGRGVMFCLPDKGMKEEGTAVQDAMVPAEIITDLIDLSDLREALWSNDLAGDALLREIRNGR